MHPRAHTPTHHTLTHTHTHTHTDCHTHARTHGRVRVVSLTGDALACTRARRHSNTHARKRTHAHTRTRTHAHTCASTHAHTHGARARPPPRTHTHTHTHTRTRPHTHTHCTHTHIHTRAHICDNNKRCQLPLGALHTPRLAAIPNPGPLKGYAPGCWIYVGATPPTPPWRLRLPLLTVDIS